MDPAEMLAPRVGSSEVLWLEWHSGNCEQGDPGEGIVRYSQKSCEPWIFTEISGPI